MTTELQWAQDVFAKLRPRADAAWFEYVYSRTPSALQDEMKTLADTYWYGESSVSNGAAVVVRNAANAPVAGSPGVADVSAGVLNFVKLTV